MRAYPFFAAAGVITLLLVGLALLPAKDIPEEGERTVQIAYAAYDTKYTPEELTWLAEHADLLIMHESLDGTQDYLKSINPDIVLLVYKFSGISNETRIGHSASGFGTVYQEHQDWFLRDRSGRLLTDGYDGWSSENSFFMDPGQEGWQEYSVSDYLISSQNWDGIFLDVVNLQIGEMSDDGLERYPDDQSYQEAVKKYLSYAYSQFSEQGKLFIINGATFIYQDDAVWNEYIDLSHGGLEESFVNAAHWGWQVWHPEERWLRQIEAMEYAGMTGKVYIAFAHTREDSEQDVRFNLGSYLLGSSDSSYFYNMETRGYRIASFKEDSKQNSGLYHLALGEPTGPRRLEQGLWTRKFENGMVLVNPSDSLLRVDVDGKYREYDKDIKSNTFTVQSKDAVFLYRFS